MYEILRLLEFLKALKERFEDIGIDDTDIPFILDEIDEHIIDLETLLKDAVENT